jgi:transcriptional regulator with XRE-family HTH domain
MSVREFSRLTGISYSTINDWKKNSNPASSKIMTICQVLKVTPECILFGETDSSPNDQDEFDMYSFIEELRIIEVFRKLSNAQRSLLWSNMELILKVNEEAKTNTAYSLSG